MLNYPVENIRYCGQIPVFKVGSDARELTNRELLYYQSILAEHHYDRESCTSSSDDSSPENDGRRFRLLPRLRLNGSSDSSSDDAS